MNKKNKFREQPELTDILENVKVVFVDNMNEQYELVQVTEKGLNIGRIVDNKLLFFGFIPIQNIKLIKNKYKKIYKK